MSPAHPPLSSLREIASRFARGPVTVEPLGHGRIHATFEVRYEHGPRLVLQRLNEHVFRDTAALMENLERITGHLRSPHRPVPALDGEPWIRDREGRAWRAFRLVEDTRCVDETTDPRAVLEIARAYGRFLVGLSDLPGPRLHETIPRFHDTPWRFEELHRARREDRLERADGCRPEIDALLAREEGSGLLQELLALGEIPERPVHSDTKLGNVLLDVDTGTAVCVVDLDTCMPGLAPHDFGDLFRSATRSGGGEARLDLFEAVARGWVGETKAVLRPAEREALVPAARLVTLEIAVRYLTDHLDGDLYFRVAREGENLERARLQLSLLGSMERQEDAMRRILDRV
jgi:Ser/Thr protein kinase RdoA (MazF antagonist)